jgi:hypothetical protein
MCILSRLAMLLMNASKMRIVWSKKPDLCMCISWSSSVTWLELNQKPFPCYERQNKHVRSQNLVSILELFSSILYLWTGSDTAHRNSGHTELGSLTCNQRALAEPKIGWTEWVWGVIPLLRWDIHLLLVWTKSPWVLYSTAQLYVLGREK